MSQGYERVPIRCPWCLMLPAINLLRAVSDHLDLLRPAAAVADASDRRLQRQVSAGGAGAARAGSEERRGAGLNSTPPMLVARPCAISARARGRLLCNPPSV
jgi:hypothetical protein